MTKTWIRGLTGLALITGAVACSTDNLTNANRNPNSPTSAPPGALFTNATVTSVRRWVVFGNVAVLTQQFSSVNYPTVDSYISLQADGTSGTFTGTYTSDLPDFAKVIDAGKAAGQPGVYGPAMVMQTWDFSNLTDQWGDVPYSQALKADSGVIAPQYDPQKDIYAGFFSTFKEAVDAMAGAPSGSPTLGSADPIYGGDLAKWRRFANSLHARYAMRIVNVDAATADAELTAAFSDAGGVFQSNADNAKLTWPGDGIYDNPFASGVKSRLDVRVARTLTSLMTNDPRIRVYAMPVVDSSVYPSGYGGEPSGLTPDSAAKWFRLSSWPGAIFGPGQTSYGTYGTTAGLKTPSYIMTYAEVMFLRAEAAERGLGGVPHGEAAADYYAAIRASMAQWGVTDQTAINAFLASPDIAYKGGVDGLKQIATQNWIALYSDSPQVWAEWRRTCQPDIVVPGPAAIVPYVPRRFYYATTEALVNAANLNAAIARQGPDNFGTRIYWDSAPQNAPTCQ
jgi:SusD/RagB-like outer membrane lipoprotein